MTAPSVAADELARFLAERNSRVYSLEQVAEMTGLSLRAIQLACRASEVEHVHHGKTRGMTLRQIDLLVAHNTNGTTSGPLKTLAIEDELDQARAASRRSGARRGRKAA